MKSVLSLDETPSAMERSLKTASKLKSGLPTDLEMESISLKDLPSLAEEIHFKTREASQQTNLDMREFLAINKALQSIQVELVNNTSKLTEINKRIERDTKKLKEVEDDPTYSDEQRQVYKDRLDDLSTEKQARPKNYHKTEKIFKHKLPESGRLLKKFLIKMHLWRKESVPYSKSRA